MVYDLTEDDTARLAAESRETATERAWCSEKLAVLETGLRDLRRLDKHHSFTQGKSHFLSFFTEFRLATSEHNHNRDAYIVSRRYRLARQH